MRSIVEEQLRGRQLPLVMAHKGGAAHELENALITIGAALAFKPDMIEVDIRKSRDGVLYCHHGSTPWDVLAAFFFRALTFPQIQKLIGQRDTLQAILNAIPKDTFVYLDLKDRSINAEDLRPLIDGRKGIWIAPFGSVAWLKRLRVGLGENYVYAFNRPAIFPQHIARRLEGQADMIQFCRWSWNEKTISAIEKRGIACHMIEWFICREQYMKKMPLSRWHGLFLSKLDLSEL